MTQVIDEQAVRALTKDELTFFKEHGWAHLRDLVDPSVVAELLRHASEHFGEVTTPIESAARGIERLGLPWLLPSIENADIRGFSRSAGMARFTSQLMGNRPARYWLDLITCRLPESLGGSDTPWHDDLSEQPMDRAGLTNLTVALVDTPPEKGNMRFLDRSHLVGPKGLVHYEDMEARYPELFAELELSPPVHLRPGDATIHNALTAHSSPKNTTDSPRWYYQIAFFPADTKYTCVPHYVIKDSLERGLLTEGDLVFDQVFPEARFPVLGGPSAAAGQATVSQAAT